MPKIDIHSKEFQEELKKTWDFVKKVNKNFSWVQNPEREINENIAIGLTRQKLTYGKRYCPCFAVSGDTKEEQKRANNRVCPCKPAIEDEIPKDGKCFCGIFCTQAYVNSYQESLKEENVEKLLLKKNLSSKELERLLQERDANRVCFMLIDVREEMEHELSALEGTDMLLPTSQIKQEIKKLENHKDENLVLYCHAGSRSAQIQEMMYGLGFKHVSHLDVGVLGYRGSKVKKVLKYNETLELRQERELGILYAERDNLLRRLRVITSVVSSLYKSEQDVKSCLESIYCIVDALGNKEYSAKNRRA